MACRRKGSGRAAEEEHTKSIEPFFSWLFTLLFSMRQGGFSPAGILFFLMFNITQNGISGNKKRVSLSIACGGVLRVWLQILRRREQIFCSRFTKEELSLNLNIAPKQKWSSGAAELSNMGSYSSFSKEGPTYLMKKTLVTVAACLVLSLLPLAGCVSEAHPPTRNCGRLPWPMRYLARTTR